MLAGMPRQRTTPRPPATYMLKFLSGEISGVEVDLAQYAEALSSSGFRNKILLKQLTKKDLVRCGVAREHLKILLREVRHPPCSTCFAVG